MAVPKVLVANRGEIAIRILRSARELGWRTVTLYSTEPTPDISHATYADEAVKVDITHYTDAAAIVETALHTECTHVHPGYGFLSESPALATALAQLTPPITFIGPSSDTLRLAGDKMLSRDLATSLGVQVAPGVRATSSDDVRSFADSGGSYPIVIKALDGGGGRGIRVVNEPSEVEEAFKRCIGESPSGQAFAEKALTGPGWKHIEIQIIGDGTGSVNHIWERECSVQRRFQKIVEVAPSRLSRSAIQPLISASLKIASHLKYQGLGTVEFLVNASTHAWVFLEINPRIQVEHTITEEISDIDLVRAQFLLFSSSPCTLSSLSLDVPLPIPKSTAIQLRLTAENPENAFQLTPGTIPSSEVQWPAGRGVRIDTWLSSNSSPPVSRWTVGTDFDSLLAKIIIRGHSFEEATQKAQRALCELTVGTTGRVKTNIHALMGILDHQDWKNGTIDTLWLERELGTILSLGKSVGVRNKSRTGLDDLLGLQQRADDLATAGGSIPSAGASTFLQPNSLFRLTLAPTPTSPSELTSETPHGPMQHTLVLTSIAHNSFPEKLSGVLQSSMSPTPFEFSLSQSALAAVDNEGFELADPNNPEHVAAPLTGKIVELHPGLRATGMETKRVSKGETLVVLSLMKMETTVVAPYDGIVDKVGHGLRTGAILGEGMLVCVVKFLGTSRL